MALFGKKKPTEEKACCCCGGGCTPNAPQDTQPKAADQSVKVLGGGCAKCNALEAATVAALTQLGMDTTIEHVTDYADIAAYGVMSTPALVVDGKVVSFGKVLKQEEVVALLQKVRG